MNCPRCGTAPVAAQRYCANCGALLLARRAGTAERAAGWARVVLVVLAAASAFTPWVAVGVPSLNLPPQHWDAFRINPLTWLWLAAAAAALLTAIWGLGRPVPGIYQRFWLAFGAVSCGVAVSAALMVRVSARVSRLLGAPNPVHDAVGVWIFAVLTGLWTAVGLMRWMPAGGASGRS